MTKNRKLETWTQIAQYLSLSVRQAQRRQEQGIPIYRDGGSRGRVYAWTEEIDAWRKDIEALQKKERESGLDKGNLEEENRAPFHSPLLNNSRQLSVAWAGIPMAVLLAVFGVFTWNHFSKRRVLHFNVTGQPPNSTIHILGKENRHMLDIPVEGRNFEPVFQALRQLPYLQITDINKDRLDDVVFAHPDEPKDRIFLYMQNARGRLKERRQWSMSQNYEESGKDFPITTTARIHCADLTGDGHPEIIALRFHANFYHSCCLVYDGAGQLLFQLWHPGRLHTMLVADRNQNGISELIIGGTNNHIEPDATSTPILISVERNWQERGEIDLFGKKPNPTNRVPKGCRLFLVNLGKDRLSSLVSHWEPGAVIRLEGETGLKVTASRQDSLKCDVRHFVFDAQFRCTYSYILTRCAEESGLKLEDYTLAGLMSPHFWNGTGWQADPCPIPEETGNIQTEQAKRPPSPR